MPSILNATTTNGLVTSADNSGSLQLQTNNGTTAVTIDTSQNVIAGSTSTTTGDRTVVTTTYDGNNGYSGNRTAIVLADGSVRGSIQADNGNSQVIFGTETSSNLNFITGNVGRMLIDSSGNLLLGASAQLSQPAKSLLVNSLATTNVGFIVQNSVAGDVAVDGIRIGKFDNNTTTSQVFMRFTINNQSLGSGSITANGANACAFGSFSDERLKENIVDLPSQLANITALRPVEFDYIESEGGGHQVGFIAQEMQDVYPDAVGERSDGMLTITGWSKTEARLVKAIQELKAELDELKAELDATKAEVQALKGVA